MATTTLTLTLDDALATRLTTAAQAQGKAIEAVVIDCIEQNLDVALRHHVLVERLETVDAQIDVIARFIEQAAGGGGLDPVDLFKLCRYPGKPKP